MRHLKAGRKLNRNATHRLALMRNLACALFAHERIITTVEKAKEARRFAERLITIAKKDDLHARRRVIALLGPMRVTELFDADDMPTGERVIDKLFDEIGPRFHDRPGGYTRIIKRHQRRLGDAGKTAFLELLKAGETKVRAKAKTPPPVAPRVAPLLVEPTALPTSAVAPSSSESAPPAAPPQNPPPS